jgi:hypothetical protein
VRAIRKAGHIREPLRRRLQYLGHMIPIVFDP